MSVSVANEKRFEDALFSAIRFVWKILPSETRRIIGRKFELIADQWILNNLYLPTKPFEGLVKKIGIIGFFESQSGLGRAAHLLKADLEISNYEVTTLDVSRFIKNKDPNSLSQAYDDLQKVDCIIIVVNPDLTIRIMNSLRREVIDHKKLIGYWVWELETPPPEWQRIGNWFHEIWTSSHFSRRALCQIYNHSIKVVPHPVAILEHSRLPHEKCAELRSKMGFNQETFIAFQSLAISSSIERKNLLGSMKAFNMAFEKDDNAFFIVRIAAASEFFRSAINRIKKAAKKYGKKIILVNSNNIEDELFDFYSISDVYLSLHRSEGFGLNLAEAMLFGLPVIATNWSGNLEFMHVDSSLLVDATLINVRDKDNIYRQRQLKWAEPDYSLAAQLLTKLRCDREFALEVSKKGQDKVRELLKKTDFTNLL